MMGAGSGAKKPLNPEVERAAKSDERQLRFADGLRSVERRSVSGGSGVFPPIYFPSCRGVLLAFLIEH